jgi:molecular chaperone DnaK (HSP70)
VVLLEVYAKGILHVKATDLDGGSSESVEIQNDKNRLTQDEIERMVEEAAQMEEQDKATRERVQARVQLEQVAYDARTKARSDEYKAVMSEEDQTTVDEAASEVITWLDDNSEAGKEELEAKLQELQGRVRERLDAAKAKVAEGPKKDDEVAADSGAAAEEEPAEENVATEDDEEDDF